MKISKHKQEKQQKGFAIMNKKKHLALARLGGIVAHKLGKAHIFTSEEARAAGRKGGKARIKLVKIAKVKINVRPPRDN